MKKVYTYYPEFNANDELLWCVYENSTAQVVAEFFFEDDAQEYSEFLEHGGAFAGFTPSFVLKKTQSSNINDAFTANFAE
jgi:hypothetical protein